METCRIPGCLMRFKDSMQRALHEVNTWHCGICGHSDGRELTMENITKVCNLCIYDKYGHPSKEPSCILILVDCKTRRYKRLKKKGDKDE
jgi:hypothetical protein